MTDPTGGPMWGPTASTASAGSSGGRVEVKRYRGGQRSAYAAFEADAPHMAEAGWFPTSQSYVPGSWGCGAWVIAFILLIFVIGIIVLAYMIVARPAGELVVTYEHRSPVAPPTSTPQPAEPSGTAEAPAAAQAPTDPYEQLRKLGELHDAGIATPEEFEATKAQILGRM